MQRFWIRKLTLSVIVLAVAAIGISQMYMHNHYDVEIVLGPGVTSVGSLSDYHPPLLGTAGDTKVIVMEGQKPGATMLLQGGTHADEIGAKLTALMFIENVIVEEGTLIVIPMNNNSASHTVRSGEGHLLYFSIPTEWGEKTFRYGSRVTSRADQWPDPEVYFHYPSGQMLADVESRNTNRSWPGRQDGSLTEQVNFAVTELMVAESVDLAVDLHQASTMFPVNNVIIAAGAGMNIAVYASALMRRDDGFTRPVELAPMLYRGLFNREISEYLPDVLPYLMEVPIPYCDIMTGPKTEALLLTGQDPLLLRLAQRGRLYAQYDERGYPLDVTVGQHCSSLIRLAESWNQFNQEKPLKLSSVPTYEEVVKMGLGHFFANPSAKPNRVIKN
ncbi:MAG: hypothetical protein KAV87_17110 [Desulfobacteraceae bacterium]|nr:hypothetical protein [Desulfobacteraceae bacterium]